MAWYAPHETTTLHLITWKMSDTLSLALTYFGPAWKLPATTDAQARTLRIVASVLVTNDSLHHHLVVY